jgi:hypothetical protein
MNEITTPETDSTSCSDGVEMLTAQSDPFALYQKLCEATAKIDQWENDFDLMKHERDEAREESLEQARLLGISGERECRLIAERDEAKKKYDIEATEHMLNINKCCNQRDEAINSLMKIEEIFIDGCDTYEDWKSMGQIARTFLENTNESRIN